MRLRLSAVLSLVLSLATGTTVRAADAAPPTDVPRGDPALGARVFVKCAACHQIGENAVNMVGPELNGVIGRHSGSVQGYSYSEANKASGLTWDPATFRRYIADPKAVVPGTKMSFAGLTRAKDIENVLAYLELFKADGTKQ